MLTKGCLRRGLLPFTNFNRLHVVPPCVVTDDEAREGLAILDEALADVDRYYRADTWGSMSGELATRPYRSVVAPSDRAGRSCPGW